MKNKKKVTHIRKIAMIIMLLSLVFGSANVVYAGESYYATWDEYKESGQPSATWNDVADAMDVVFEHAKDLYASGDATEAYNSVNDGYYGYYETTGFERIAMGYISGSRKTEVELQFSACKAVAKNGGSADDFNEEVETLKSMIRTDANILDGTPDENESNEGDTDNASSETKTAAVAAFTACFSIMIREGLEAILIVGAIIAYLTKATQNDEISRKKKVMPVYIGSVIGIIASFVMAWLLNVIKLANTASQEIIEGVTALLAVAVLYYVSNWMLSKSETDAWTTYIKKKTEKSSEKGSMFALAFTAFLAVFREGAEVVLFFQPMLLGNNIDMVWAGFVMGCVCLVFIYLAIRLLSIRIPIKPFFTATSILMFLMSISFLGAGIKELIEGDVITMYSPSWLAWIPTNDLLDVLGIYPILQTLIPQLLLLIVTIVIFVIQTKKNRRIHMEAEKKREEERMIQEAEKKKEQEDNLKKLIRIIVDEALEEKINNVNS